MVTLRDATPANLSLLERWEYDPAVIESGAANDDWHWAEELGKTPAWREQLVVEVDGVPAGFVEIIDPLASNTDAIRFYERRGFRFVERRMFGADDCHVMRLERTDASQR